MRATVTLPVRPTLAALTVAAVVAATAGAGGSALLLTGLAAALGLAGRRSVLGQLPAGLALAVAGVVVSSEAAAVTHMPVLNFVAGDRALLTSLAIAMGLGAWLLRPAGSRAPAASAVELAAALPALVVAAIAARLAFGPLRLAAGALIGGWDNTAHLQFAADIQRAGALSYAHSPYPRGLHTVVAVIVGAAHGPARTPQLLAAYMRALPTVEWAAFAVLVLAAGLAVAALCAGRGYGRPLVAAAAAAAGAVLLTPWFLGFCLGRGFFTTAGLAAAIGVAVLEAAALRGPAPAASLLTVSAAVLLAAQSWQLGVTPAAVCWAVTVVAVCRRRPPRRVLLPAAAGSVVLGVATLPAVAAVLTSLPSSTGAQSAGGLDPLPALPFAAVLVAAVAVLAVLARRRRIGAAAAPAALAAAVLATVLSAVVFSAPAGFALLNYYPRKLLWHAVALGLPLVAAGLALAAARLRGRAVAPAEPGGPAAAGRGGNRRALLAVLLVGAVLVPVGTIGAMTAGAPLAAAVTTGWGTDIPQMLAAVTGPHAADAGAVWGAVRGQDELVGRLLAFYHPTANTEMTTVPFVAARSAAMPGQPTRCPDAGVPVLTLAPSAAAYTTSTACPATGQWVTVPPAG